MAPKRKVVSSLVRTTKKKVVVEEQTTTVAVAVLTDTQEPKPPHKVVEVPVQEKEAPYNATQDVAGEAAAATKKRKRRRRVGVGSGGGFGEASYKRYVMRVLQQVHPGMGVSSRAMAVLDGMMGDMFERIAEEAARLSEHARKATLSSREIHAAVLLVLPGELGRHAVAEGTKAVTNYMAAS